MSVGTFEGNEVAIIKKIFSLFFLFVLFIGVVACNKDVVKENGVEKEGKPVKEEKVVNIEKAEKLFKDYSTELYTIKDSSNPPTFDEIAEKIKVYLTEEQYNAEIANRKFQIPELVSKQINKSIEVQDVKLEEQSKNDDGTIDYLYTTKFKVYDENSSKIYEKVGELTISTTNNELKIDRDWSRGVKIDGLDGGL
ncbi:hypothetical protein JFV29_08995 [Peribacillus sp. TH16]|uniref:hypothetical protein n=1 Tax=unclassified Peribacillus TaxID=2675266 RepID=UPI001912E308|nr:MULTISPECIES: hypothetical protein [unclassified Peribacillus]MBK5444987.1 hypothetical protein [Peribacillus sp. TH24]MBK5482059.1 hypothetical protein [Peribacillus sp. TH16]